MIQAVARRRAAGQHGPFDGRPRACAPPSSACSSSPSPPRRRPDPVLNIGHRGRLRLRPRAHHRLLRPRARARRRLHRAGPAAHERRRARLPPRHDARPHRARARRELHGARQRQDARADQDVRRRELVQRRQPLARAPGVRRPEDPDARGGLPALRAARQLLHRDQGPDTRRPHGGAAARAHRPATTCAGRRDAGRS